MGTRPVSLLIVLLLLAADLPNLLQVQSKKQTDALDNLYRAKSKPNSGIDTAHFNPVHRLLGDVHDNHGSKEKDRIKRWPGQPARIDFEQYGGYVTVDESAGRALYYYFVEAPRSKKSAPLLLWLNGGPGCSSLAYGAFGELGPFRIYSDGKALYHNKYSWVYAANVLFLESPAGTGFSYSNRSTDYQQTGDRRAAEDNYIFLLKWLQRFPEYKDREFYISGESYAGHYVPQLAQTILSHNKKANKKIINLKGILIGNPVIDDEEDKKGMYEYLGSHALISQETAYNIKTHCDFSPNVTNQPTECESALNKIERNTQSLELDNIYEPLCTGNGTTSKRKKASFTEFDECSEHYVIAYLNTPDVQEAIHANVTKLDREWETCSSLIDKSFWTDSPSTTIPLLKELMANGLRVWIFSGDVDGTMPVTSTQNSLNKMKLPVKTQWHPWYTNEQIGGYTQVYKGDLTFATVRGAGHEVPSYQPLRALALVKHFLDGTPLPDTKKY